MSVLLGYNRKNMTENDNISEKNNKNKLDGRGEKKKGYQLTLRSSWQR